MMLVSLAQLPDFLTSTSAPWWSALLGVLAGGVLTFLTSFIIEKRKSDTEQARFDREQTIRDRNHVLSLVAQLDAQAIAHLDSVMEAWDLWGAEYPDHRSDDGSADGWTSEAIQRYKAISAEARKGMIQVHGTAAQLRVLSLDEIDPAVDNVAQTAQRLRPSMTEPGHLATIEALQESLRVLRTVVAEVLLDRHGRDSTIFDQVLLHSQEHRLVVGEDPGIKQIFIHETTESTIMNVPRSDMMLINRAAAFMASNYADEGKSSVVWVMELMDGSFDVYAVALETEGDPVTNVQYTHPFEESEEAHHEGRRPFTQITFNEDGSYQVVTVTHGPEGPEILREQTVAEDDFAALADAFNETLRPGGGDDAKD